MIIERTTSSEAETIALGEALGALLSAGDVVALVGELGAGKTRLVRGVARALGVDESTVSSPTFVLVHEYPPITPGAPSLIHADAYRLADADEIASLGWDQIGDPDAVVVVEWADRIERAIPSDALRVVIEHTDDGRDTRRIRIEGDELWTERLAPLA